MSIFYVYQGDTYELEFKGGYVWSPKLTKSGRENVGYSKMTQVRKGDFILHHCQGKIVAISITQSDCKDCQKPLELEQPSNEWRSDGYIIYTNYVEFDSPVILSNYKNWLIDNYKEDSAFTKNGTGKQQYMCSLNTEHAIFLLKEALAFQTSLNTRSILNNALSEILNDTFGGYNSQEKESINHLIEEKSTIKPTWTNDKEPQAVTLSSLNREIPKRNINIALNALAYADYSCEVNNLHETFLRKSGKPYTEPHHLIPISKYRDFQYSLDVMQNIVSLCSHCHNLLHYGRIEDKLPILKDLYDDRIEALRRVGIDLTFEQLESYYK